MNSRQRMFCSAALWVSTLTCLAVLAFAGSGDLDPNFGTGGKVTTRIGSLNDSATSLGIQTDGKIVVAGNYETSYNFDLTALARYNPDGSLDSSFGSGGEVTIRLSGCGDERTNALALQSDGKIVVAGIQEHRCYGYDFGLARFKTDGSLDTSFGGGAGEVHFVSPVCAQGGFCSDSAQAVALQADGKIIEAGYISIDTANNKGLGLMRVNSDGSLDTSFGTSGMVTTPVGSSSLAFALTVVIQPDGKIVAAGYVFLGGQHYEWVLARYNSDGTLDSGFGSGGIVTSAFGTGYNSVYGVALQSDGKLVVAGRTTDGVTGNPGFTLARYNTNGTLDTTFGPNVTGIVTTSFAGYAWGVPNSNIAVQADGKIPVAGFVSDGGSNYDWALVRYNPDGTLDGGFGTGGIVITSFGAGIDEATALGLQSDGNIVVAGFANNGTYYDFAVARYIGGPSVGPLDHLVLSPATATIVAGGSQLYTAEGFDANNHSLGDMTSATTFTVTNGTCTGAQCTSTVAGSQTVTGASGGKTGMATLSVNAGALDHLVLAPGSTSITFGGGQAYTASGFDAYTNNLGDVTVSTTFTISPDGSCSGATCTPSAAGPHMVGGTDNGKTGTASLQVNKASPVITWNNPSDIVFGTSLSGTQLNATADVAGAFSYTPLAGTVLNAGNGQTLSVSFTPTDTANYNNAAKNVYINVLKAGTSAAVRSSLNPSIFGQSVTFTATVTSGSGTPTGSVQFFDGATSLGTSNLSGGSAVQPTAALGAGSHSITAVYNGAPNFFGSTSAALSQIVAAPTSVGSNVPVQTTVGSSTITTTFANVTSGGPTTVAPADPSSIGTLPGGFNLSGSSLAFDIQTKANFLGPVKVCFQVPSITDATQFANLRILHSVGKQDLAVANGGPNNVSILLGNGAGGFSAATNFAVGSYPWSVAVGDFNNDGKLDLAVANRNSNNVSILLGNGAGGFSAATNFPVGLSPISVAVGDFNNDGKLDLAVANYGSNNVSILLGNGTGGFSAATNFAVGLSPVSVAVADFNNDGKLDLAVANNGSNNVSILLGNGAGGFSAATNFAAGSVPWSVAVGDFNNDGKLDLAVANYGSNNVSVLLGNGAGGFSAATNFAAGSVPWSVAVGDFNNDGKLDLAVANRNSNNVSILLGNGAGGFNAATNFPVGSYPWSVAVGDFNNDGKLDLAVRNYSPDNNVSILLGDGAGGFSAATNFPVGTSPFSVAVGNFNGDTSVVDQTILSGPNAPNFASKTICASVTSFSPFVLAGVVDHTPPTVAASLTPVGQVGSNAGQFRVGFSATDDYDPAPTASAVMAVPTGTESFQVVFVKVNVDQAAIAFDLQKQVITLAGRDEATLRGLLATLRANGGAAVTQGQVLPLVRWQQQQFAYLFLKGVLLGESAPTLTLKVTAQDAARNVGIATAVPTFGP